MYNIYMFSFVNVSEILILKFNFKNLMKLAYISLLLNIIFIQVYFSNIYLYSSSI